MKLALTILFLLTSSVNSFAQLSKLITDFKPAYARGAVDDYIDEGERIVLNLNSKEKEMGERILTLFKVLTAEEQDMSISDFNKALNEVGLSSVLQKELNSDLALISIKSGAYNSYMVFNQSKKSYRFSLKGIFKTANRASTTNFDGGVSAFRCRVINYSITPYTYTVTSVTEIQSIF